MRIETMRKQDCCGCAACVKICPKQAITFSFDKEGFRYPHIDKDKCVNCGLCEKVCMFKPSKDAGNSQRYYAAKSLNILERMQSRSGGIFFVLAKKIIELNGVVYGATIDEEQNVKHIRATDIDNCRKMQGSKYVESDLNNVYEEIKHDLQEGKKVLFSGTACQVAGLYGFLGKSNYTGELYTTDIVCHGVTSQKVYSDFKYFLEQKYNGKIEKYIFRNKAFGWDSSVESYVIQGKMYHSRYYTRLFYSHAAMRPSCSNCPFASFNRPADITLADFWGLKNSYPEFDDNKGVSSIIINSAKGDEIFRLIVGELEYFEVNKDMCKQPNLVRPTPKADNREAFWNLYYHKGFKAVMKKYGGYDFLRRFKWNIIDLPKMLKVIKKKDNSIL